MFITLNLKHTDPIVTAVACAATFVPFLVCLNPSTPQDLKSLTSPKKKQKCP